MAIGVCINMVGVTINKRKMQIESQTNGPRL